MTIWGDIALDGARRSVTVEREYAATVADLWSALTEPERLARWIGLYTPDGDAYRIELRQADRQAIATGRVLSCEVERSIRVGWRFSGDGGEEAATELEVVLEPVGADRARLTLSHRRVQAVTAAVYGARWEDLLTRLAGELGGGPWPVDELGYVGEAAGPAAFDAALEEYRREEAGLVPARMIRDDGRSGVHLERMLDAPIAAVWDALTRPERIGRWLWPVVEWPDDPARIRSLRQGDTFRLGDAGMPASAPPTEVLAIEEGRLFSFTWGADGEAVTVRLEPHGDDTLFELDQEPIPDVFGAGRLRSAPDFAAGWHSLVDGLALLLNGLIVPKPEALWEAAYEVYAEADADRAEGGAAGGDPDGAAH